MKTDLENVAKTDLENLETSVLNKTEMSEIKGCGYWIYLDGKLVYIDC